MNHPLSHSPSHGAPSVSAVAPPASNRDNAPINPCCPSDHTISNSHLVRRGSPETTKPTVFTPLEALGDLPKRVYDALSHDVQEQGIASPLPEIGELQLRRTWVVTQGDLLGHAQVGSFVGFMRTSIVPWLWSSRSARSRAIRDTDEYLLATHEMTHSVGEVHWGASPRPSSGFPTKTRLGLILLKPLSHGALFHSLEETNARLASTRAGRRIGLKETTHEIKISALRSPACFSTAERKRLVALLSEFSLGEPTSSGDRVIRTLAPVLEQAPGVTYRSSRSYLPLLAGMRTIAHHIFQAETPDASLDALSKLLSQAHAGDFSAYRTTLRLLGEAVGSDGIKLLALVRPAVRHDDTLVPILAEALTLSPERRALFTAKLYQLATGELPLSETLREGRVPSIKQVDSTIIKTRDSVGTARDRMNLVRFRDQPLSKQMRALATTACAGAIARGEHVKAYKILLNTHHSPSALGPELARELSKVPLSSRALAHIQRSVAILAADVTRLFRR